MKLFNVKKIVECVLDNCPETRDNDYLLWLKVLEVTAAERKIPDLTKSMTVGEFLEIAKYSKLPNYETVSRARRKVQERCPNLRATEETQAARAERQLEFKEFARNG